MSSLYKVLDCKNCFCPILHINKVLPGNRVKVKPKVKWIVNTSNKEVHRREPTAATR